MTDVCITADDYGLRAENDAVIESLARAGRLDAVSVAVHEGASLGTVASLRESGVATGLHLVLVGERPLARSAVAPLLEADGFLPPSWHALALRLARRPRLAELLRAEIDAQLARYDTLGLPLDFVNGHQHVHLFPPVWRALRAALRARDATPAVRAPRSWRSAKDALISSAALLARPRGRPLRPYGLGWSGHMHPARIVTSLYDARRCRDLAELVFHPGAGDEGAAPRHLAWGYAWRDEARMLASGEVDSVCGTMGARRRRP